MDSLQEKLINWSGRTVEKYIHLANNGYDNAFYTQSDWTRLLSNKAGDVDVMILGINPGSEGKYSSQKQKKEWGLNGNDMTGSQFLKGNPFFNSRGNWRYWQRLQRYFAKCNPNPLNDETRFVLTNMCNFSTPKANQVPSSILNATKDFAIELIDIIKPKRLVFLSGKRALGRLNLLKDFNTMPCNIFVGTYLGIPCLGVPHPSAYITRIERSYIAEIIAKFMLEGDNINAMEQIDIPKFKMPVVKQVKNNDRLKIAEKVLKSLESEKGNRAKKGTGLRKDREYVSFCNGAFELYAAGTKQEYIQLFVKQ